MILEKEIYNRLKTIDFTMLSTLLTERTIMEFSKVNRISRQTAKKYLDKYHLALLIDITNIEDINNFNQYSYTISEFGLELLKKREEKINAR